MKIRSYCRWSMMVTLPVLLASAAPAADADDGGILSLRGRRWLLPYDSTLISRRLYSELSYENHDHGDEFWKIETTFRWAVPLQDDLALGMQMMVPVKWNDAGGATDSGMGDIEMRAGVVGRIAPNIRYGMGLNAVLETATDDEISGHALVLRPLVAAAWDVTGNLTAGLHVEYNFTPRDEGDYDESALELKFPLAYRINDDWSAAVIYKPKFYFIAERDEQRLECATTRLFGVARQYSWSIGAEAPLSDDSLDYKVLTGLAWIF